MQRRGDAEERGVECSELRVESGEKGLQGLVNTSVTLLVQNIGNTFGVGGYRLG